jgi:hypothetical protein
MHASLGPRLLVVLVSLLACQNANIRPAGSSATTNPVRGADAGS